MKIFAGIIAALFIITANSQAQVEDDYRYLSAGPYFSVKAGINGVESPPGRENSIAFAGVPDFGVCLYYPLGLEPGLGSTFNLGYSSYAYKVEDTGNDKSYTFRYGYLSLAANMHFDWLMAGFNIGLPVSASFGEDISLDKLNPLAELRIGFFYPLMMDEGGSLNIFIKGGYMLTGIYEEFAKDSPLKNYIQAPGNAAITNRYNPRAVSVSLGFNYLVNL